MLYQDTTMSRSLNIGFGALLFTLIISIATYFLQRSLILYRHYDSYTHWAVVLLALPLLGGIVLRLYKINRPSLSVIIGAIASAAILYPQYQKFWATPPSAVDMLIYIVIISGIGFIASQPIKTTIMLAFRMGKFSLPPKGSNTKAAPNRKEKNASPGKRMQVNDSRGNTMAMIELMVGFSSLVLSIISIFFLGKS